MSCQGSSPDSTAAGPGDVAAEDAASLLAPGCPDGRFAGCEETTTAITTMASTQMRPSTRRRRRTCARRRARRDAIRRASRESEPGRDTVDVVRTETDVPAVPSTKERDRRSWRDWSRRSSAPVTADHYCLREVWRCVWLKPRVFNEHPVALVPHKRNGKDRALRGHER